MLIDHPWNLDAVLDAASDGFDVLRRFNNFVRGDHNRQPLAFIEPQEYEEAWQKVVDGDYPKTIGLAFFFNFAYDYVRYRGSEEEAHPRGTAPALKANWRRALRDGLGDGADWRSPQIIITKPRQQLWQNREIEIEFHVDGVDHRQHRVIAVLEEYDDHPYAISDFNAWDLRKYDSQQGGRRNPCRLPMPPVVRGSCIEDLAGTLARARAEGWVIGGRHYYIPPAHWDPVTIGKGPWRDCRAFPQKPRSHYRSPRPVDYENREWVWDHDETQWDVQTGPRRGDVIRVSHTGERLADHG